MKRSTFAVTFALLSGGISTPCLAQTQYYWTFDEPFVVLPNSGHHLVTATIYNTGTTALFLRTGVTFELRFTPEFLAVTSNRVVGPTSSSFDFTDQFFASSNYPIVPGTSFQFAALNFDYDAPDGLYADFVTGGYLRLGPDPVAPSNNITYSFKSGVPEPATWVTMITGFGLIGAALRRRRRDHSPERGRLLYRHRLPLSPFLGRGADQTS